MNTKNNKRRQESRKKIESIFIELLQIKELSKISVSDICKKAQLNRTTFYSNYADIYELADSIRTSLEDNFEALYRDDISLSFNSNDYLRLFTHIWKNQLFYKTYFKLGYDNDYKIIRYDSELAQRYFNNRFIDYHCAFFRSGITTIIKMWLDNGCMETPEEMNEILLSEYQNRH